MREDECLICKKHYTQGGTCYLTKQNCLMFDLEPKGKMIRTNFTFSIDVVPDTPVIQSYSKVIIDDKGKDVEMIIIKINRIDLNKRLCSVTAEYHEKDKPYFERKKLFKLVK